ncbi:MULTISPECIES: hypothetical protein [Rhizobium]|uniref:hypothetical protein n=1 Tax=Rhizobium TaxID=379 RepID=UPI00102F7444|nr:MULTISPECIES: hypothetical protein [Rhizobium]TAX30780.1 hypothetical protein ELI04_13840 [Rhizobium leguminosarum]TBD43324.1 hypothetical protein ELH19_14380 [Rhizobium ruizarguesonis]TBE45460.1 hypothetical protein ELH02_14290 [Rhizobium ruizarguesonis]
MDYATDIALAPLDELIELLPKIEKAKERARLGTALQKATASAARYDHFPVLIEGLVALVDAADVDFEAVRSEIGNSLSEIVKMSRILSGEPTIDQLDAINQIGLTRLPFEVERIENYVEGVWRKAVQDALGGQAALGEVLTNIPGVEALGRDLERLAARAKKLEDASRAPVDRVKERNALVAEASALNDRLLAVGVAPPIANFLVAVAARPVRLSDLTDEILGWIRDHDALALFTVSVHGAT